MDAQPPVLSIHLFRPGQRIAVAVSGGADSVALLRRLIDERSALGIVLSVAHVHHGIRGLEADGDAAFAAELAAAYELPFHLGQVDVPAAVAQHGETLEEAARKLRYAYFEELMERERLAAVATAHTLDDQAETVLFKLVRGAWTEGLSGIHPVVQAGAGSILRPFLEATRSSIEAWLRSVNQSWREDATNLDLTHTRNRIRHQLLPQLSEFNPEIARQLSRLAAISAAEEQYWQIEMDRLLPSLLLPGKPIRGGGRSNSTRPEEATVAIELERLKQLPTAVGRRVLRAAVRQLGARLSFDQTERLMTMGTAGNGTGRATGTKVELPGGIVAERTLRELRLTRSAPGEGSIPGGGPPEAAAVPEYPFAIPGEVNAPEFAVLLHGELVQSAAPSVEGCCATLRNWKAGDRVTLRHSRGPKKVTEILDRLRVHGTERSLWPVVEAEGRIVWMRGVEVDAPGFLFTAQTPVQRC
jgi:tRNA(Ile)-lysidine synthase